MQFYYYYSTLSIFYNPFETFWMFNHYNNGAFFQKQGISLFSNLIIKSNHITRLLRYTVYENGNKILRFEDL